ncbi:MAG TPA: TetR/AcrR family transcriptional regulator [Azospirillum sp.]|nr:TetR/AcrR family transcriptional regulator [Azospirillum sp.]
MSRKVEILRRATEVFVRQGVNRTSIEDIAKAVGIKREGVYYYFKSRTEILLKIIVPQSNRLVFGLRSIMDTRQPARDKLYAAVRNHLDTFNPSYLEMAVALREKHYVEQDDKLEELRSVWRDYDRLWVELVREGQASGEFRPDFDPKIAAYGILGMCNWLSRWYDPAKEVTIEQIIDMYFTIMADGLCTPEARDRPVKRAGNGTDRQPSDDDRRPA